MNKITTSLFAAVILFVIIQLGAVASTPLKPEPPDPVRAALQKRVTLDYPDGVPLYLVLMNLERQTGIHIEIDVYSLEDLGIDPEFLVKDKVTDISLANALSRICKQVDPELTWDIFHKQLRITTKEAAFENMRRIHSLTKYALGPYNNYAYLCI